MVYRPLNSAGSLKEPPISDPIPMGTQRAPTAPASPPVLPPTDLPSL